MSTSNNSVTLIPKPQHHIVHREEQWMMIDSEIRKRLTEPVLTKSVIAIFGTAGIGKSTFLRETLITRLQEKYSSLPVSKIDFDKELADQRYDGKLRGNILIDLIAGFEKSSNKSANIDSLKRKWETAILKSSGKKRLAEVNKLLEKESFAADARKGLAKLDKELAKLGYDISAHEEKRKEEFDLREIEEEYRKLDSARELSKRIGKEISELVEERSKKKEEVRESEETHRIAAQTLAESESLNPNLDEAERELFALHEG